MSQAEATELLNATPDANTEPASAERRMGRVLEGLPGLADHLDAYGRELAGELADSHRRVRGASGEIRRGLRVEPQEGADVLGVYVYLPVANAAAPAGGTA